MEAATVSLRVALGSEFSACIVQIMGNQKDYEIEARLI